MKKSVLFITLIPLSVLIIFLTFAFIFEYRPEAIEQAEFINSGSVEKNVENLTILTWNTGYAGLGKNADFFMDGGVSSRPSNENEVKENLNGIVSILRGSEADMMLLQEVDRHSSRTFKIDQSEILKDSYVNFELNYASNFKVLFVPSPLLNPIGIVDSGLLTVSGFKSSVQPLRVSLPIENELPVRLFNLKRCMLVSRYKTVRTGRDLVVINLHLSAYENETLKTAQLDFVKKFILDEFSKGNSVITGGDWNHMLPGVKKGTFGKYMTDEQYIKWAAELPENWTPDGWNWAFNKEVPTVRNNEAAYVKGQNFVTVIDGFLVSPDVTVESVTTIETGFEYSDHQPVVMRIKL
ncbi:MAG TPA: endonuclease/exonuclease/phosphatase family protein [bacterium]|nr:endonuclease/exonuclease/phosphatase family protein [bacterium]HPS30743.1 endonuclease/exonuclease/phosphatase family protein [bacterium]